jgi:hypothetical protein
MRTKFTKFRGHNLKSNWACLAIMLALRHRVGLAMGLTLADQYTLMFTLHSSLLKCVVKDKWGTLRHTLLVYWASLAIGTAILCGTTS